MLLYSPERIPLTPEQKLAILEHVCDQQFIALVTGVAVAAIGALGEVTGLVYAGGAIVLLGFAYMAAIDVFLGLATKERPGERVDILA